MDCASVHQLLNDYLENNLNDSVARSLSEHLQECRKCAIEEALLRILVTALRSLPERSAPSDFTEKIMERLPPHDEVFAAEPRPKYDNSSLSLEAEASFSTPKAGLLSTFASRSGLLPTWIAVKMVTRPVKFARYLPRPTVKLRTGVDRARSLTKLPLAMGFRW